MMTPNLTEKYNIEDVVSEFPSQTYNIYITGLAGCHCVSETATNIADYFNSIGNSNYQIYIIEDLTRYAFVPLSVSVPGTFSNVNLLKRFYEKYTDLSLYIFEMIANGENMPPNFKLLTKEEVDTQKDDIVKCANGNQDKFFNYFHYLVPLKETIDTYKKYNNKIKLLMNPNDENLKETLRETANGGRKNKTKKNKKNRKRKLYTKKRKRKNKKISKHNHN